MIDLGFATYDTIFPDAMEEYLAATPMAQDILSLLYRTGSWEVPHISQRLGLFDLRALDSCLDCLLGWQLVRMRVVASGDGEELAMYTHSVFGSQWLRAQKGLIG